MGSVVPSSSVIFDLKPSPRSYLHPKIKTKVFFLFTQDLLVEGVGLCSTIFSLKERETKGEDQKDRKQKVSTYQLANGRKARKAKITVAWNLEDSGQRMRVSLAITSGWCHICGLQIPNNGQRSDNKLLVHQHVSCRVCVESSQPQILLEWEIWAIPTWISIHMSSSVKPSFQHRGGCESYCSLRQCHCCLQNQDYIHTCVLCVHNSQYNFLIPNVCMYSGMLAPPRWRSCTIWPCSGHVSQSWNKRVAFICNMK